VRLGKTQVSQTEILDDTNPGPTQQVPWATPDQAIA
jgi:hypothetical protein